MNRIADTVGSPSFATGQEIRELRVLALNRGSGRPLPGTPHPLLLLALAAAGHQITSVTTSNSRIKPALR